MHSTAFVVATTQLSNSTHIVIAVDNSLPTQPQLKPLTDELRLITHPTSLGWGGIPYILCTTTQHSTSQHISHTIHAWRQGRSSSHPHTVFMIFSGLGDRWASFRADGPSAPFPLFGCFGADLGAPSGF